ncbi:MAG: type II toxin-antitoxin system HicB family antitoxin, partial [Lachnospiraceae bacterium]|nr:type II toxin-antitoxin system HicB family antitoxin [Lachnospiraceae bacterium]
VEAENDTSEGITLTEMDELRQCNGRISVRVPKQLHRELVVGAKNNGVSLNQYIVYKLAKG